MRPADGVVISFDPRIFFPLEHVKNFWLVGELEEIIVVPGVPSQRSSLPFEQFNLAVYGEHLLHKSPPKMEQPQ